MPCEDLQRSVAGDNQYSECAIWRVLELHRCENHEEAIRAWNELSLPQEMDVWKWIGVAQASIASDRLDQAEELLDRAIESHPENAVAFYFRGVLRLQQAHLAYEWPEVGLPRIRLALLKPRHIVPNTRSMYELAATIDFEWSIELAHVLRRDEVLGTDCCATEEESNPTVADLLVALSAENFEAKAHNVLGNLFLKRGALEIAEQHLDSAALGHLEVASGYRELADKYHAHGRHRDAMRANLKLAAYRLRAWYEDFQRH
jgi:tetratricopeptide (TPR) repeat protein